MENFRYSDEAPLSARRAELAAYLRRGLGQAEGSMVFLGGDAARDLAELLEADSEGEPGEGWMRLPVGADGKPVKPGEEVWTPSGDRARVLGVRDGAVVLANPERGPRCYRYAMSDVVSHESPDSAPQIISDLRRGPCAYFTGSALGGSCADCPGPGLSEADCWKVMGEKLAARAEKLAEGGADGQR